MKQGFLYFLLITAVLYAGLSCQKELSGDPVSNAEGTLDSDIDGCLPMGIFGYYLPGVNLTEKNYIEAPVTITKPGPFTIHTDTLDGFYFNASGNFPAIGRYKIKMNAAGKPLTSGLFDFTIFFGASVCKTTVVVKTDTVLSGTNNDHFPLTANSYWIYDDLLHPGDTIKRTIADSVELGGSMYKRLVEAYVTGLPQEYFFRKNGNDYFEYCSVDKYTSAVSFVPSINAPIPFLKETLVTGDTWKTIEYKGISVATGKPEMLQYVFHCENADANIYINGKTYQHLYNITMEAFTRTDPALPYQSTREINGYFYARGIGIIYMKKTNQFFNRMEIKIRDWQVK